MMLTEKFYVLAEVGTCYMLGEGHHQAILAEGSPDQVRVSASLATACVLCMN